MAGTAYHMEALRKARAIERKTEAMKRLQESAMGQSYLGAGEIGQQKQAPLVFAEPGHYAASRHSYYKVGPERDRRQYDHSRNGPVVDRTKHELKREFNWMGSNLRMLNSDIRPAFKPMPMHRHF